MSPGFWPLQHPGIPSIFGIPVLRWIAAEKGFLQAEQPLLVKGIPGSNATSTSSVSNRSRKTPKLQTVSFIASTLPSLDIVSCVTSPALTQNGTCIKVLARCTLTEIESRNSLGMAAILCLFTRQHFSLKSVVFPSEWTCRVRNCIRQISIHLKALWRVSIALVARAAFSNLVSTRCSGTRIPWGPPVTQHGDYWRWWEL